MTINALIKLPASALEPSRNQELLVHNVRNATAAQKVLPKQSINELPSIMSSIGLAGKWLISFLVIKIVSLVQELHAEYEYSSEFVTRDQGRYSPSWSYEDLRESDFESERTSKIDKELGAYYGGYTLRYKPLVPMPRLFWHKFQLQETTTLETPVTMLPDTTTTEEPEMPEEPEQPATTEPPPTMPPTTTALPTSSTTESPRNMSTVRPPRPTHPISTVTNIMKPFQHFIPKWGAALKNLFIFGSPIEANLLQKRGNAPKTKSKGILNLFEVIKFENNRCYVSLGDIRTMEGMCYHDFDCKSHGGISTERCADGAGVCCIFLTGCGDSTSQSVVYFESPNYPHPVREMMICVLIVNVPQIVQQLRVDFLMFELNRPTNGDCIDDEFIITGQNINFEVPILCGINTGQQLYIHVGNSFEKKIYLSFFFKAPSGGRTFNIKITQLEENLAPDGCLQFYTETEGIVKSFNYDTDGTVVADRVATYLNNLNYVICMERANGTCTVRYATEQLGGDQLDFQIINKDEAENDLVPDGQAGAGIFNCPNDYIAVNQVRLCGERLNDGSDIEDFTVNAIVTDISAGPILLPVRTDEEYVGRGFRLVYKQELCA